MKKLFPLMVVAVVATMFTSCKKDYSCTCTTKITGMADQTTTTSLGKQKKSDAETACTAKASSSAGGTTASVTCKLD